jgi:RNA polymerase sigma factor (sigma-70 family)
VVKGFDRLPVRRAALWERSMSEQAILPTPAERLEAIYHAHAPLLRATAKLRYRIPLGDVDALVHDVFASFLERQPSVHDVRAYLLVAINHACKYYWRKRRFESPLLPEHDDTRDDRTTSQADQWAMHLSLGATLAQLGEKCRETLKRYYIHDEKPDAIARSMETTPGYVFQLLHSCRKRARDIYRKLTEPAP